MLHADLDHDIEQPHPRSAATSASGRARSSRRGDGIDGGLARRQRQAGPCHRADAPRRPGTTTPLPGGPEPDRGEDQGAMGDVGIVARILGRCRRAAKPSAPGRSRARAKATVAARPARSHRHGIVRLERRAAPRRPRGSRRSAQVAGGPAAPERAARVRRDAGSQRDGALGRAQPRSAASSQAVPRPAASPGRPNRKPSRDTPRRHRTRIGRPGPSVADHGFAACCVSTSLNSGVPPPTTGQARARRAARRGDVPHRPVSRVRRPRPANRGVG